MHKHLLSQMLSYVFSGWSRSEKAFFGVEQIPNKLFFLGGSDPQKAISCEPACGAPLVQVQLA